MKTPRTNRFLSLLQCFFGTSSIIVSLLGLSHAASVTWDTAIGDATITGGPGNWDTATQNWTADAGATNSLWNNLVNDTAIFTGTGGTVTLTAPITANGLTISSTGYAITGGTLTLAGPTPTITTAEDATLASIVSGSAGLVKAGPATLSLSAVNTYTGGTTIEQGTLRLGSTAANPNLGTGGYNIASGATLRVEYATTTTAATALPALSWGNFTGAGTLNIAANGVFDYIPNAAALPAGFTGTLKIDGGRVQTPASGGLGGTSKVVINPGGHLGMWENGTSLGAGIAFEIAGTGYGETTYEAAIRMANGGGTSTINGPILLTANASISTGGTGIINGIISGGEAANFNAGPLTGGNQAGTIELAGPNTFAGKSSVSVGTLRLANTLALQNSTLSGSTGVVAFNASVASNTFTLGGLEGSRNLSLQNTVASPITLDIGNNNADTTYSGILSGAGALTKTGSGSSLLTGASTYTGATTVNGGELVLLGAATIGGGSSNSLVSIASGASLAFESSANQALRGGLAGAGSLDINTTGTLTLAGDSEAFEGHINHVSGNLAIQDSLVLGTGSQLSLGAGSVLKPLLLDDNEVVAYAATFTTAGAPGSVTIDVSNAQLVVSGLPSTIPLVIYDDPTINGSGFAALNLVKPRNLAASLVNNPQQLDLVVTGINPTIWEGDKSAVWDLDTTANWTLSAAEATFQTGDITRFDDTAAGTGEIAVTLDVPVSPGSLTFANATRNYSITGTGAITGTTALAKSGAANLTLATPNSYTGPTTISAGTLTVAHPTTLGATGPASATTITGTGTLDLNGTATAPETFLLNGGALANSSATAVTTASPVTLTGAPTVGGSGDLTLTGTLNGAGSLIKTGTGTLRLNAANTFEGGTTVRSGTLLLGNVAALGTGNATLNDTSTGATDTALLSPAALTSALNITVANHGTGTTTIGAATGAGGLHLYNGEISLNRPVSINGSGDRATFNGLITGNPGTIIITGATSSRVTFGNAANDFTGDLVISPGVLYQSDSPTALPLTTSVTGLGDAQFRLNNGGTHAIDALNGSGQTYIIAGGNATLSLGNDNGSGNYSGRVWNNAATLALNKTGTGTQILSGANDYTGTTTITGGTLVVPSNKASQSFIMDDGTALGILGAPGSSFTVSNLDLGLFATDQITLNINNFGGQTLATNAPIRATGTMFQESVTTVNVAGYFPESGTFPLISYPDGGVVGAGSFVLGTLPRSITASLVENAETNTLDLNISNLTPLTWTGAISDIWNTSTNNWTLGGNPAAFQSGDLALFDDTATGSTTVTLNANVTPSSVTFENSAKSYTLGGSGGISGTASLLKFGSGTLTLTNANTHSGVTFVGEGTLRLGDGTTDGSVSGAITNNASLILNPVNALELNGVISGVGSLTKSGLGTATLTSAATHTGATLVSQGTLTVQSLALASPVSVANGAALEFTRLATGAIDPSGPITGAGSVAYTGPNPAINLTSEFSLNDASTYTGGTSITGTRAQTARPDGLGTGPVSISNGGQLYFTGATTITNPFTISGTGWPENAGNLGTIRLNNGATIAGTVTLAADARIGAYSSNGVFSGAITGNHNLEIFSQGGTQQTVTFSGSTSNTYTGTTTVLGGVLAAAKSDGAIAIPGNLVIGNAGAGSVWMKSPSQYAGTGPLVFTGISGNGRFHLMGNTHTFAGLSNDASTNQTAVVQNSEPNWSPPNTSVGTLVLNVAEGAEFSFLNGYLRNATGVTALTKNGAGRQILGSANINYTGPTTVNAGTLTFQSTNTLNTSIHNSATVEIRAVAGDDWILANSNRLSGNGTWVKTGAGRASLNSAILNTTGQFQILEGTLRNNNNAGLWNASTASMAISGGAILDLYADAVYVDALTGSGFVQNGFGNAAGAQTGATAFFERFVVGVAGASSVFDGVIRDNATNSVPASGAAGGGLQFEKVGPGDLTLNGANLYTGSTSIFGGSLVLGASGSINNTSSILVASGAVLDVSASPGFTLTNGKSLTAGRTTGTSSDLIGTIGSAGTVNIGGSGTPATLRVSGELSLLNAGSVVIDLSSSTASGNDLLAVAGNINLTGITTITPLFNGAPDTSNPYTIATYTGGVTGDTSNLAAALPPNTRYAATFDANTPGVVKMNLTGTGEALTWTGATNTTWSAPAALPDAPSLNWTDGTDPQNFQNLDTVTFNDTASGADAVTVVISDSVTPALMTVDNASRPYTLSGGSITGGASLTKRGASALTLSQANSFTGGITLVAGSVTLTNPAAAGSGLITLGHPDTNSDIVLNANAGSGVFSNPINVSANGTGAVTIAQNNAISSLAGTLTLNRATTIVGGPDRTGVSGRITGNVGTLTFAGNRTTLDNSLPNDFVGNIAIASGATLQTNAVNAIPESASVAITGNGQLRFNAGANVTLTALEGGVTGTNNVNIIAGPAMTLTLGANNGSGVFNGNITTGLNLDKIGSGTQTLGGSASHTGLTRILGGSLKLTNLGALSGSTLVMDNLGGSLDTSDLTTGSLVLGGLRGSQNLALNGLSLDLGTNNVGNTYEGAITLTGEGVGLIKRGTGDQVLGGSTSNSWSGNTTIVANGNGANASLILAKTNGAVAIPANTAVNYGTGTGQANLRHVQDNQYGENVVINFNNPSGQWTRFDLWGTHQTIAGGNSGNLTTLGSGIIQNQGLNTHGSVGTASITFNGSGNYLFNGYLRDTDAGPNASRRFQVIKDGSGTQSLIGAQILFTGDVTVNGGKLNGTKLGASNANRTMTVNPGAILEFGAPNVFGNHNTLTVPTIIVNGGTLTNADLLGTNNVNNGLRDVTLNNGTLTASTGNNVSFINPATRPGEGYGAWGFNGTITSTGTSGINVGSVTGMGGRILLSSNAADTMFNVVSGTLTVSAPLQTGESAVNYGLAKTGAGTLLLTAENLYTGNTTVNEGTLELADNAQLKFVISGTAGVSNKLTGLGTAVINGDFVIETAAAASLTEGTWQIENVASLTGPYGDSFSVVGFEDAGNNTWIRRNDTQLWTFAESTGTLTLTVNEDSYANWIAEFNLSGDAALPSADPDGDGLENAVEMVVGGNPATGMDANLQPTIELVTADPDNNSVNEDYLLFTYRRTDLSISAGLIADCETNTLLSGAWTAATGAPGVVILIDDNFASFNPPAANTDRVRVFVPRGSAETIFGRLNLSVPVSP